MKHSLDYLFAVHCAPAMAGIKPANLISCSRRDYPDLDTQLEEYRRAFAPRGVCFQVLCACPRHFLILVYRPQLLGEYLARPEVRRVLNRFGYPAGESLPRSLARLGRRIRRGGGFPHEVGLFLGYPVEDVEGFIRHEGRNYKVCGPWKVYGDVDAARRSFDQMARVSRAVTGRVERGETLFQVFAVA